MFKKILVICRGNILREGSKTIYCIKSFLHGKRFRVVGAGSLNKNIFSGVDLVITLGGDGTFLRAASFVKNQLILGINSNPKASEGALTSFNADAVYLVKEILGGKFKILIRQRISVWKNGKLLDKPALNEAYIGSRSQFHTSRYKIYFNGKCEEHRSSGVLISTGTGSTAWYSSAGGRPFHYADKKLKFIVREPFFGKLFRPIILHGEINSGQKIKIESTGKLGSIVLDSNASFSFETGDVVEVGISDEPLRVITNN
ncbi:NAD(+)/NADH kinase [Candidatus Pacearchaeota archaeon]|nr:NAD(+)/NADH kinase [Candidatus Pacearchaeota archaeon]